MRLVVLSLIALLFVEPALAQRDLTFGFRVGVNHSSLVLDYDFDTDFGTERERGFGAAASAEAAFTDKFAATAEASYARRAYSYPIRFGIGPDPSGAGGAEFVEERITTSLDLASIGVLARVLPFERLPLSPYVTAGPRLDVLLESDPGRVARPEIEQLPEGLPPYYEDELPGLFADVSLSGVIGFGVAVEQPGWPKLRAQVSYDRTLTDFLVNAPVDGSVSGFDLSVGFMW